MRWRNRQQSSNVDDRRSRGSEGPRLPSIGAILFLWPVVKTLFRSKIGLAILGIAALAYFGGFLPLPFLDGGGSKVVDEEADNERALAFYKKRGFKFTAHQMVKILDSVSLT